MARYFSNDAISAQTARKTGIPIDKVAEAVDFQFLYVAETIRSGKFDKGIRLPYFGVFAVNRRYLKYLKEKLMTLQELDKWKRLLKRQGEGRTKVSTVKLLRLIETTIAMYDRIGGENVNAGKADLVRKGHRST